jgi:hypothetical protein
MRIIIRRENPHPGAQLTLFEQHEGEVRLTKCTSSRVQYPAADGGSWVILS